MEDQLTVQNNDIEEQNNQEHQIIETVENNDKGKVVSSRPNRSKYVVWNKNDGGSDNLTPIERLIYFLLMNGGDNLDLYIGNQEENKVVGRTRAVVIQNCVEYFKERGIKVTASSVRSKINIILETGAEDSNTSDTKNTGKRTKEECEEKLSRVCPRFSVIKEMLNSHQANTPFYINNNLPTMSVINPQDLITNEEETIDDTKSTDYYTTDEDNNFGHNRSSEIVGNRNLLPKTTSSLNHNKKRSFSNIGEAIRSEAKKNDKKFMTIMSMMDSFKEELKYKKDLTEREFQHKKKLDLCKMQVDAYLNFVEKWEVPNEERIAKIKEIQDMYFKDGD
ncbi:hypothetical protein BD770DRAFT_471813 [Pilaira anomala]|nr:hypothetical protein BD770DRAFT_471813 [Pilaira anomala]